MMIRTISYCFKALLLLAIVGSCTQSNNKKDLTESNQEMTAKDILGNPEFPAISYGGYRQKSRTNQPSVAELKEDLQILHAMGIRMLRTYNVQLDHASNVLKAISELKKERADFEMYVMLGAWIDCKNAWTDMEPDHNVESDQNEGEIGRAVVLAKSYPDIVKVIAVGNEAMVKWAASYFVQPDVILKWVNYLQDLKRSGELDENLWITSSDNFASWGGGSSEYHVEDLNQLIEAVDFISMHTYPMHDTHYNPIFWGITPDESKLSKEAQIEKAMKRSLQYAQSQYESVKSYMEAQGVDKPIHIGETGWASYSNGHYGNDGAAATDEYKEGLFHQMMRDWTEKEGLSCFYFEAFDEQWKDATNPGGSENHFGLFTLDGKAKYALWDLVDQNIFDGLSRAGKPISKTYEGNIEKLMNEVLLPPLKDSLIVHKQFQANE